MKYETVIGLEIHAQLLTKAKVFCNCPATFGASPNSSTCPICMGFPGVLPVLNKKAVEFTIKTALATHCQIMPQSQFARKNYFYPDLPKGYQISQYSEPIAKDGFIEIETEKGEKKIGIVRIHMEEDAGKLVHQETIDVSRFSYVDFNRASVPLMEIVSKPDIRNPEEAAAYLRKLRAILQYLDVCDGNMEEGSFRCDANVSIMPVGEEKFGTKAEIKNMNSFKHVQKALEYEMKRQQEVLEEGAEIIQETRLWDATKGITTSMRGKEEAHDYRYFSEPDLLPLILDEAWIEEIRSTLPELPDEKKERFIKEYQIPRYDAEVLTSTKALAQYYEECLSFLMEPKMVSNWIMTELLREIKGDERELKDCPVTSKHLTELLMLIKEEVISGKIAKTVFEEMWRTGKRAEDVVRRKGLVQVRDIGEIENLVEEVLATHPNEVEAYRKGKEKLLGFFVGEVMKATQGKANPKIVNEILKKRLS